MIELPILNHTFDEEAGGFGEPARAEEIQTPSMSWTLRLSIAAIALGALVFLLAMIGGSNVGNGTWGILLGSLLLMGVGTTVAFVDRYKDTTPGIKHDGTFFSNTQYRGWIGWGLGIFITTFYIVLYWYGDLQKMGMPPVMDRAIDTVNPLAMALTGKPSDQWFLYGTLYTLLIGVFGVRMIMRYRHSRYHLIRTCSVMFFQLGFAFMLPGILKRLNEPEFYFTYFWPLKPNYAWPGSDNATGLFNSGTVGMFMIGFGIFATLILTPTLTYFYGKRWYCSWVCGCGGLAETLGDPWRQLSNKSSRAWLIERVLIYSVLAFIIITTAVLWFDFLPDKGFGTFTLWLQKVYGFVIVNAFAGVIGVGFYPIMGSRVWCRFGCPMAAILGILQKTFSRFRITTNGDQCMSCGNCSTYCEMGIDVRAYAQRGENIVRASCVGCGVCAAVCPRGVLKLENGKTHKGREPKPLDELIGQLKEK